jgi:hypothetical protein
VSGLLPLLEQFRREKLAMLVHHEAGARLIGQYDANNTYQYIINREEAQLSWLASAISDLGGEVVDEPTEAAQREVAGKDSDRAPAVLEEDARDAASFVERWAPLVERVTDARHQGMLRVILGETLEMRRSFEQALAGRTDLLGRRGDQLLPSHGVVLATRWIE